MITIFNAKTVYIGFNLQKMREMQAFLQQNGVKYRIKMHNMNKGRGQYGSMGIRPEYSVQYELLIRAKDAEQLGL